MLRILSISRQTELVVGWILVFVHVFLDLDVTLSHLHERPTVYVLDRHVALLVVLRLLLELRLVVEDFVNLLLRKF